MTVIAVTQRVDVIADRGERRDALDQRWYGFLQACGCVPLPVPNDPAAAEALVRGVAVRGVLLTGGNTLCAYGGDAPERDATEAALLQLAQGLRLPVIGVCRGMQVVQHHYGVPLTRVAGHVTAGHSVMHGGRERVVNSFHELGAVASVPALEVLAMTADGVIESVRHAGDRVLGMMWHPERNATLDPDDVRTFREWFNAA